jgi:hypothetical protein
MPIYANFEVNEIRLQWTVVDKERQATPVDASTQRSIGAPNCIVLSYLRLQGLDVTTVGQHGVDEGKLPWHVFPLNYIDVEKE